MYAWSKFKKDVNEWGVVQEWIMPGDEISQSDLDVSDEEWQNLIDSGAVREEPYPDIAPDLAPAEHFAQNPPKEAAPVDDTAPAPDEAESTETAPEAESTETTPKQPWQQ